MRSRTTEEESLYDKRSAILIEEECRSDRCRLAREHGHADGETRDCFAARTAVHEGDATPSEDRRDVRAVRVNGEYEKADVRDRGRARAEDEESWQVPGCDAGGGVFKKATECLSASTTSMWTRASPCSSFFITAASSASSRANSRRSTSMIFANQRQHRGLAQSSKSRIGTLKVGRHKQ